MDFGVDEIDRSAIDREELKRMLAEDALALYDEREEELGEELMRVLERYLILQIIDQRWREHLYDMDYLREGIHLRGFAQIEPLVAYKNEAFTLFDGPDELDLGRLRADDLQRRGRGPGPEGDGAAAGRRRSGRPRRSCRRATSARWSTAAGRSRTSRPPTASRRRAAPREEPPVVAQRRVDEHETIGRNDPCWCGSGKKFKKCHGA